MTPEVLANKLTQHQQFSFCDLEVEPMGVNRKAQAPGQPKHWWEEPTEEGQTGGDVLELSVLYSAGDENWAGRTWLRDEHL